MEAKIMNKYYQFFWDPDYVEMNTWEYADKSMDELNQACKEANTFAKFKILVKLILKRFYDNADLEEHRFPAGFSKEYREYIHSVCRNNFGMISKSYGEEPNKQIRIRRNTIEYQKTFDLPFDSEINDAINECTSSIGSDNFLISSNRVSEPDQNLRIFGRLSTWLPPKVAQASYNKFYSNRMLLPVWNKRQEFLQLLNKYQIVLICAETGSGKTTQIPQFILENACEKDLHCKIICTQPRRISTIAVAERVAEERGETLGDTVGYQIKLESKIGFQSALVYCTNGILLRTLMNNPETNLRNITHLIIDEIHERDKFTDFLLISLKQYLKYYPELKIILMSATADVELFMTYFPEAALLHIPGKLHTIDELFLDDILFKFNSNKSFIKLFSNIQHCNSSFLNAISATEKFNNNPAVCEDMGYQIEKCVEFGDEDSFTQLMDLIVYQNGDINFQTKNQGFTSLIAAAMHGKMDVTLQLLKMGVDISITSREHYRYNALQWAKFYNKIEVLTLLEEYDDNKESKLTEYLVNCYEESVQDETIDSDLIVEIIIFIRMKDSANSILIFLPGYEDIINCQEKILSNTLIAKDEIEIFMLHSCMPMSIQHSVFSKMNKKQKIILSTNIAETSITIPDVVYVIDTGLTKEKAYDSITGTGCLRTTWIAKANVIQRAGRAGRTRKGTCFHTFSKLRYSSMLMSQVPEILRVPLHDLCIQTKLLAPKNCCIADYLQLGINPPSKSAVNSAIQSLKTLGALDDNEGLTNLGQHLVQFAVDPRLGKMLIFGVIFKCLDPILTIVSSLAHQEPFTLPLQSSKKSLAAQKQRELSENSLSDHVVLLKAYHYWQDCASTNRQGSFTKEFFINASTMSAIHTTRTQLLSQLRAAGFVQNVPNFTIQDLNKNSGKWHLIKAVLTSCYYPNLGFLEGKKAYTKMERDVNFMRTSCLSRYEDSDGIFTYHEVLKSGNRCMIKCSTLITPVMVALLCGYGVETKEENKLVIDEWLFIGHNYPNLLKFRCLVQKLINCQISDTSYVLNVSDHRLMNAISLILSLGESIHAMPSVNGTGRIPKLHFGKCSNNRNHSKNNFNVGSDYSFNNLNIGRTPNYNNGDIFDNIGNFELPSPLSNIGENFNSCRNNYYNSHERESSANLTYSQNNCMDSVTNVSPNFTVQPKNGDYKMAVKELPSSSKLLLDAIGKISQECLAKSTCIEDKLFFIIKVNNHEDLNNGICLEKWLVSEQMYHTILSMLSNYNIYFFFSIVNSNNFQGFAQVIGVSPDNAAYLCKLNWLSTNVVFFAKICSRNLRNTINNNLPVYCAVDGQTVNYSTGVQLGNMFFEDIPVDFYSRRPILEGIVKWKLCESYPNISVEFANNAYFTCDGVFRRKKF